MAEVAKHDENLLPPEAETARVLEAGASEVSDDAVGRGDEAHGEDEAIVDVAKVESSLPKKAKPSSTDKKQPNNLKKFREERMISKAELARRANLSVLTIDRLEKGFGCRMDTKRKILEALGLNLADRLKVFGEEE